jgi:hypothetical protein
VIEPPLSPAGRIGLAAPLPAAAARSGFCRMCTIAVNQRPGRLRGDHQTASPRPPAKGHGHWAVGAAAATASIQDGIGARRGGGSNACRALANVELTDRGEGVGRQVGSPLGVARKAPGSKCHRSCCPLHTRQRRLQPLARHTRWAHNRDTGGFDCQQNQRVRKAVAGPCARPNRVGGEPPWRHRS